MITINKSNGFSQEYKKIQNFFSDLPPSQMERLVFTDVEIRYIGHTGLFRYDAWVDYTRPDGAVFRFQVVSKERTSVRICYMYMEDTDKDESETDTPSWLKIVFHSWPPKALKFAERLPKEYVNDNIVDAPEPIYINQWDMRLEDYGVLSYYYIDQEDRRWQITLSRNDSQISWGLRLAACDIDWESKDRGIHLCSFKEIPERTLADIKDLALKEAFRVTGMKIVR